MKKLVLLIIVLVIAGLVGWKLLSKKEASQPGQPDQALKISKNSGSFNSAFAGLLNDYYALKDALVAWDTVKADQAAYALAHRTDSLPVDQIKGDSDIVNTAKSLIASVGSEAKGIVGEGNIEQKRRGLNMLTGYLYDLIRTVRYDAEIVYHERCPMAFNGEEEGFWLSNSSKIVNPYLGDKHPTYKSKMLGCGEVVDSVNFAKK
ncbi:DUF3347 domain-containing protein [Flavitalea sp. BT771]|uniref:DUF3347 domain-containing protein n=1 Tax=Flavitalea sp. BT771 TaxID=3063329 RepID=UPI0026E49150|nr:DUF3347 domain-containing protein [Flavitalea sp. BT771]MDO6431442.1 DUF3347 domain-containing protein [Flavitalea sp. BT771]MDV6220350.1 DUF3347 domain-containing protein [Flavitalea sp. BT771]